MMRPTSGPTLSPHVSPVPLLTAAEFAQRHGGDYVELIQGAVRELPMPYPKHGRIGLLMGYLVEEHGQKHDLGRVVTNDSFVQTHRNPDTVRGADVAFYSFERLARGKVPDGLLSVVPDLVVEVRSPSERWTDLFAKVVEYLQAGVRVVIVLDEPTATASVYRPDELQQIFHNGDTLVVPDVLPGFSVPVQRLFEG
jgi:Uma2 family endonuclease